jgi:hypothetical protein
LKYSASGKARYFSVSERISFNGILATRSGSCQRKRLLHSKCRKQVMMGPGQREIVDKKSEVLMRYLKIILI